jgi:nitroimidazol reductase NimA-like FMN-containing flavoprotein (pyridoxamine 5'-phosphate oxidase superfamily)
MHEPRLLSEDECVRLIRPGGVGRVAVTTPSGPEIFPVNFIVHESAVIFRTSPFSVLGTFAWGAAIAFQTDQLDVTRHVGWSVVAFGRGGVVDRDEIALIRARNDPEPWARGARAHYIRLRWERITGRALGRVTIPD